MALVTIKHFTITEPVVVSYKNITKLLEIKYMKHTKARNKQLEYLHQCMEFEKVSHGKYKIYRFTGDSYITHDGRARGNNSTYNRYSPDLLLNHLVYCTEGIVEDGFKTVYLSTREIRRVIGFCNSNYSDFDYIDRMVEQSKTTRFDLQWFYSTHSAKCNDVIKSTLNQVCNMAPELSYCKSYYVNDGSGLRATSKEEAEQINLIKQQVMWEIEVRDLNHIYLKGKQKEYWEKVKKTVHEVLSVEYKSEGYLFIFPDYMGKGIQDYYLDESDAQHKRISANTLLLEYLHKQTEKDFKEYKGYGISKTKKEELNGDLTETDAYSQDKRKLNKVRPDHVAKQRLLLAELVKIL